MVIPSAPWDAPSRLAYLGARLDGTWDPVRVVAMAGDACVMVYIYINILVVIVHIYFLVLYINTYAVICA